MEAAGIVRRVPGGFNNLKCLIYASCQGCPGKGVQGRSPSPAVLSVQQWKPLFKGMREYFDHFSFFNLPCTYAWGKCIWHIVSADFLSRKNKTASNEAAQRTPIPGVISGKSPLYLKGKGVFRCSLACFVSVGHAKPWD